MLEEQKDNINADEKSKLEALVNDLKECIKNKDASKVDSIETQINEVWQAISQRVYGQNQGSTNTSQEQATEQTTQENVQDADFEVVE
jgi:molecular chaperone DnaK